MTGKWLLAGGSAIFLSVGAAALVYWRNTQPAPTTTRPTIVKAATPDPPTPAPTFFGDEVSLTGLIQAQKTVAVAAPIDGAIQEVMADAGSQVFQGQVIARIRNGKLDTTLESATAEVEKLKTRITNLEGSIIAARLEASRAAAEASAVRSEFDRLDRIFQRQQMLLGEGATPRLTYEKAEREFKQIKTEHDSAVAVAKVADDRVANLNRDLDATKKLLEGRNEDLENAKEEAGQGELKSPVDGVVISRKGAPGEQVSRSIEDFFVLAANLTALQVAVDADPLALPRIKPGQVAGIRVAESGDEIPGLVREVKGEQVLVDFVSPDPSIKPGLTANVRITLLPRVKPNAP